MALGVHNHSLTEACREGCPLHLARVVEMRPFDAAPVNSVLAERGAFRGKFSEQAHVAQNLKMTFRMNPSSWVRLSYAQQEALDNMANKMARILTGDPNEKDAWLDIGGYATLAMKDINT